MASLIYLFIAAAVLTTVLGQRFDISSSVTNGTQDYFRIAQAELLQKIKIAEMNNNAVEVRFLDRLAVIELQQQQVLNDTQQVNQTIIPLQALSLARKYCIQTHDSQFVTYQSAKEQYMKCNNRAQNAGTDLISSARSLILAARNYAVNTLFQRLDNCRAYNKNQTHLEKCYIDYVQTAVEYVQGNLDKAEMSREQSIFNMNAISLSAVQCSFNIEKVVLETIAFTLKKINDCVNEMDKKYGNGNKYVLN